MGGATSKKWPLINELLAERIKISARNKAKNIWCYPNVPKSLYCKFLNLSTLEGFLAYVWSLSINSGPYHNVGIALKFIFGKRAFKREKNYWQISVHNTSISNVFFFFNNNFYTFFTPKK